MSEWLDEDGYPTDAALERISTWDWQEAEKDKWHDFMAFVKSIWWAADMLWREGKEKDDIHGKVVDAYRISAGGWSGNESIIAAMQKNFLFWRHWVQSRRGGHYIFFLEPK